VTIGLCGGQRGGGGPAHELGAAQHLRMHLQANADLPELAAGSAQQLQQRLTRRQLRHAEMMIGNVSRSFFESDTYTNRKIDLLGTIFEEDTKEGVSRGARAAAGRREWR